MQNQQVYEKESERLKRAGLVVERSFPLFGKNKRQELTRLVYEISKRDDLPPESVLTHSGPRRFAAVKQALIEKRYPAACDGDTPLKPYLPAITLKRPAVHELGPGIPPPRIIFVEEKAGKSVTATAFRHSFPHAEFQEIPSLKEYLSGRSGFRVEDYNKRNHTYFIVHEPRDFFKRCPCTKQAVPCGYHIFNLAFGCLYECTYCFLQEYVNTPGIIFPSNLDAYFARFRAYRSSRRAHSWHRGGRMRIGTGEFSDSLMLEHVTGYAPALIEFFKDHPDVTFEFKTKSANIDHLLQAAHGGNIVVAWSLNPQSIIDTNEFHTAPLESRLGAARRCADAGYRVAFHFDPVLYHADWEAAYTKVIEKLFTHIRPGEIAWISLGTLRFKPDLKPVIEKRFPANTILDEELIPGYDGKLRYTDRLRHHIYQTLFHHFAAYSPRLPLYLCMESKQMWDQLKLPFPF